MGKKRKFTRSLFSYIQQARKMEREETAVESRSSLTTPHETLNGNDDKTIEDDAKNGADEPNRAHSNLSVTPEHSGNPIDMETCLESSVTPNETDFLASPQSHVSLEWIQVNIPYLQIDKNFFIRVTSAEHSYEVSKL